MGIVIEVSGSFDKTLRFLERLSRGDIYRLMDKYGPIGVDALAAATPHETGLTSQSWSYKIEQSKDVHQIVWLNDHIVQDVNVAVLIQYGHGTGTGGYVAGTDYINPATKIVFDQILADIWKEVTQA